MRLLYLLSYLKGCHRALTQNDTASPQVWVVWRVTQHTKMGASGANKMFGDLPMSSLRVMASQSTHASIITAEGIIHAVMGTSTLYF